MKSQRSGDWKPLIQDMQTWFSLSIKSILCSRSFTLLYTGVCSIYNCTQSNFLFRSSFRGPAPPLWLWCWTPGTEWSHQMELQGEPAWSHWERSQSLCCTLRFCSKRWQHAQHHQRWEVASPGLQPEWWMEWGTFEEWAGLGTKQLHHTSEQPGKAFMVPWASVTQCGGVSVEQSHQWQLPGSWKREQSRAAIHLAQVRRTCLPLQDQYHLRWKGICDSREPFQHSSRAGAPSLNSSRWTGDNFTLPSTQVQ